MLDVVQDKREPSNCQPETKSHVMKPCGFCRRIGHRKENCRYKKRSEKKRLMEKQQQHEASDQNFKAKTIGELKTTRFELDALSRAVNNLILTVQQSFSKQLITLEEKMKEWLIINHPKTNAKQHSQSPSPNHSCVPKYSLIQEQSHEGNITNKISAKNSHQKSSRAEDETLDSVDPPRFTYMGVAEQEKAIQAWESMPKELLKEQKRSNELGKEKWVKIPLNIFVDGAGVNYAAIEHYNCQHVFAVAVEHERGTKIGIDRGEFIERQDFHKNFQKKEFICQFRVWRLLLERMFPEILTDLEKKRPRQKKNVHEI